MIVSNSDNCVINSNNPTTNNITINQTITPAKRFTMSDLTPSYITERLTPVITKEICKSGIGAITELMVEVLLQKDGKYCYYCSDKSRKKFMMLIDHEGKVIEEKDPNAQCLRSIISIPLEEIVSEIAKKHSIKSIQKTYKEVSELKRDGQEFSTALASVLPCDADGIPESMKAQIEAANDVAKIRMLEDRRRDIKTNLIKKEASEDCPYVLKEEKTSALKAYLSRKKP